MKATNPSNLSPPRGHTNIEIYCHQKKNKKQIHAYFPVVVKGKGKKKIIELVISKFGMTNPPMGVSKSKHFREALFAAPRNTCQYVVSVFLG